MATTPSATSQPTQLVGPRGAVEASPSANQPLHMDETNERILAILAARGRVSMREIADLVGRPENTVRERVAALERRGIVMGYEARIDWNLRGLPLQVLFEGYCPPEKFTELAGHLQRMPNVVQALVTTGTPNLFVVARVRDMPHAGELLLRLGETPMGRIQTRTSLQRLVAERQPTHVPDPANPGRAVAPTISAFAFHHPEQT